MDGPPGAEVPTEGPPGAEVPVSKPQSDSTEASEQPGYDAAAYAAWTAYYASLSAAQGAAGYNAYYNYGNAYPAASQTLSSCFSRFDDSPSSGYTQPQDMVGQASHTVWVGGLPIGTTEQELRNLFGQFGCIDNIKMLHEKNCAFVRFSEIAEAYHAHTKMQGQFIGGQQLKLGWGKPDDAKDDGPPPCKNLWLGNIGMWPPHTCLLTFRS
jgi:hypothetical protein